MKFSQRKNKKTFILLAILVLAIIGLSTFLLINHFTKMNAPAPSDSNANSQAQQDLNAKRNIIENPESQQSSQNTSNTGTIALSTTQTASDVTVFTKINNVASGTCKLEVTSANNSYSDSADVIYQPEYSSCAGFSVPKEKLGSDKEWTIKVTVSSPQGTINNSTSIEVTK